MSGHEPSRALLLAARAPLVAGWTSTPIPSLSLSAAGLLALADLGTVARRTVVAGGASWLDALVLAPGLHHQQAVDAAAQPSTLTAIETCPRGIAPLGRRHPVRNAATVDYLERLCAAAEADGAKGQQKREKAEVVIVNVGLGSEEGSELLAMLRRRWQRRRLKRRQDRPTATTAVDRLSHILYVLSPLLTLAAIVCMVLLGDWWGLAFILALMLSRALNIASIRNRSRSPAPPPSPSQPTTYVVELGRRVVLLRGRADDLRAVTARAWLRERSRADGYREAAGKLIVYAAAACGGNLTQAGAMALSALLLLSAALLGLSNGGGGLCELRVHGRVARPERRMAAQAAGKEEVEVVVVVGEEDLEEGRREGFPVEDVRGS
ncbi:hypothetical protein ISF_02559 [Cordyceps fumosorosea ARSEF 2679]|uniref:Uncharacterized protein n=1 Tax=Cordyceps fumosorosea (strain ARSEF 2679) TaxID=1081104 RepID=A0A168BV14_CORFA|nr:hypothetical protein ISF_02559 [Cordyceps fumosorosea ARSEF 2679]OAA70585.1 hypothetical protein ISF_02559 [Cordyceps fumosorosea ARSEF 2679]